MENKVSYAIAMNIYRALGGELSGFDSVEEVYAAIDAIYAESGGRVTIEPLNTTITGAGTYRYDSEDVTGYKPVEVTVDVKEGFNFGVIGYTPEESELANAPIAADLAYSKSLYDAWDPSKTSAMNLYRNDAKLVYAPNIDTSNVTNMSYMFQGCSLLTTVPLFDTSNVTTMSYMFQGCSLLTTVPLFDTSKVGNMQSMFENCRQLTTVPLFNTSNVTNMYGMFYGCYQLTTVPLFDTSKVTTMYSMFNNCSSLTIVPLFDTSKVTTMYSMFGYCSSLSSIPQLDTSNVTSMSGMFNSCSNLSSIPQLDTSNVTSMDSMFSYCSNLTSIPLLDVSNLDRVYRLTYNCSKLQHLGGFKNLGMKSSFSGTNDNYFLYACPLLTYESIMNVINNLYDRATAGYSVLTLKLHANVLALLSDEDIAIATNKGWTIA